MLLWHTCTVYVFRHRWSANQPSQEFNMSLWSNIALQGASNGQCQSANFITNKYDCSHMKIWGYVYIYAAGMWAF